MGKTLYMECMSGISGDMAVASLLDLGADENVLKEVLQSLSVRGFQIAISRVKKSGLDMCDFDVQLESGLENHDHDMQYLYGHDKEVRHSENIQNQPHSLHHSHEEHHHEEDHYHHSLEDHHHSHEDHYHHSHAHRTLMEVVAIIESANMTERAKQIAKDIFTVLGEAEAKAHGATLETVHFHEVGAVDSIVDIIAFAVCLDNLQIEKVIVPYVCEGVGTVRCQHGILPIPVPAVSNIIAKHKIAMQTVKRKGELVTPTGAAIVAAVCTDKELPNQYVIDKIGMGAGKRNYEQPSILRSMLITPVQEQKDTIYKLESNIDDCTGENLGYVMERLMEAGARDVHYIPVFMKKNRPAYELCVICEKDKVAQLEEIIFENTTTIGIRKCRMERTILPRKIETMNTKYGEIQVKICILPSGEERRYPEYESVAKLARESNVSYQEILNACK